ncbi:hypothetical protein [Umezakia ovalisporum]|jgi:hypothetical protein|uniref:DUF2281 domain-containing protein n=2 Tax=Umezakia ovalisporum TaxID=75695 RepID=A0AA43KET3_9CYAN|nr:hypothetical protein [Umezakia ovalisporum]MBI1241807.1 hypothetical protein [Nostoc sp. RI_552]MDH6056428.1 hypothetical protein [Umezakia ovalisporum FSS-43]MDH6063866.1 hypothetical protein [Umezakia ovalisporum FSS-62]MDH6066745.1 hypothetical protein [Umezakia ovalisporum APH033B]MDH6072692.1 hypothetical protein [Umezakia ovalisporum CobakiLakeA]
MLKSIEGIYKYGKVELTELPEDISESRVIVTFLDAKKNQRKKQMMQFGIFAGKKQSTAADFKIAEFYGDIEDSLDWL